MEITSLTQLDVANGIYTYADYLLWKFKERVELFKGKIFEMSAPSPVHQEIAGNLYGEIYSVFKDKKCKLYSAPFDVRLSKKNESQVYTVVQPDLCIICDLEKIDNKGCVGAPDLVVEILSPGNSKKEMKNKFELYEEAGVREYWIIDPERESISIYILQNGKYIGLAPVVEGEKVVSHIFPNLEMDTKEIFRIRK